MKNKTVTVIGGGLAGSEAAYYLASRGIKTTLVEMKPKKFTPAHTSENYGELVCSNSLKSNDAYANACGLLKEEMRLLGSMVIEAADATKVPAGAALAVDREKFSAYISEKLKTCPNLTLQTEEVTSLPEVEKDGDRYVIIATGPLTAEPLSEDIKNKTGGGLHFFDASAPIVLAESIDLAHAFTGDRYGKGTGDYINCPMTKEEYYAFVDELLKAERAHLHEFEKGEIFEGCMPVEVMASRGRDTLRFGTLKPVGLADEEGKRPYAVLQLRKENEAGTMYNLVGFQTNLKFPEQKRVFSMIPALHSAEYLRYGVMHRNTYIHSPDVLNPDFSFKNNRRIFFAGQITGVEGYVESAASGLLAAIHIADEILDRPAHVFDEQTVCGALEKHISTPVKDFQPMNANYGILSPLPTRIKDKKERYHALSKRAIERIKEQLEDRR
ncbi:MAG: methylenetetrahydrofolate--tRNA-(uracil(54)-C(5))-methyltransferase (FADH(2)-oxidizing) TrmFO [Clostridiales bacterium]|nr:methylenetetrahydrofolate--tRNA-(uracil(54)-C(5))-methyltransferase (FADH(2)-oxidizing) TrmFO [Clostridiales bacterium]MBQ2769426.1 methylenetetrahydrofolate--tRNA-(uracil(54)-C(5))-methyltransferase (FADH(2)-oxidizing) TrmFO [Clostridia bacterium]